MTGGRRGYRLRVAFDWPRGGLFFPGDVVVDAELGILLRCISFAGSQPLMRYELRDVVTGPSDPGDFRPDIPAGMPVVEEPDDPPGPVNPVSVVARQAVKEARSAVRNLLGVIRARRQRDESWSGPGDGLGQMMPRRGLADADHRRTMLAILPGTVTGGPVVAGWAG